MRSEIIVVVHNIRSIHNVGSIFRTSEGFGVSKIILSGYSPYPKIPNDTRLPHIFEKMTDAIHKTALGAEKMIPFKYSTDILETLSDLKNNGYLVIGLEQDTRSVLLQEYISPEKAVLVLGEEVEGLTVELRDACDVLLEIPMVGAKESFNVSVAAGIALYQLQL